MDSRFRVNTTTVILRNEVTKNLGEGRGIEKAEAGIWF